MIVRRLSLIMLVLFVVSGLAFGQTINEKTYPQQFASPADYEILSGTAIMSYQEAPMLAERVASGELPPVEERLPGETHCCRTAGTQSAPMAGS